jgi:hypothetical protein
MAARLALVAVSLCLLSAPAQAGEQKKAGGLTYVQLPPMAAIAFRPDGRRGVLTIETGLDVKDAALRARVEAMTPRLRDAYVSSVQSYARTLGPGVPPDADRISAQLQRETDRVLGKPGAKLLLGTILVN